MIDEYLVPNSSFLRLYEEYKKYGSLVIAYDFDNTVYVKDECTWEEANKGLLDIIYRNGVFKNSETLDKIRKRLNNK